MGIFKNIGGNIPGGNFLGGSFPEGIFRGGSLMGGNFPGESFYRNQPSTWILRLLLHFCNFSLQVIEKKFI